MRIKRNLSLAIGLLASILGLSIAVDTAMADGCCCCCSCCGPPCPNTMASCDTMACASTAIICTGQDEANCGNLVNVFYVVNNDFPRSCVANPDPNARTKCDAPLRNCKRPTKCVFGNFGCVPTVENTNVWESAAKNTTDPC